MKLFKVTFETHPIGNPLFLFHPCFYVEAPSINEAPEQAQKAFNLIPANIPLTREIVEIRVVTYKGVSEEAIFRYKEQGENVVDTLAETAERSEVDINDLALKLALYTPKKISDMGMTTEEAVEVQKIVNESFKETLKPSRFNNLNRSERDELK